MTKRYENTSEQKKKMPIGAIQNTNHWLIFMKPVTCLACQTTMITTTRLALQVELAGWI